MARGEEVHGELDDLWPVPVGGPPTGLPFRVYRPDGTQRALASNEILHVSSLVMVTDEPADMFVFFDNDGSGLESTGVEMVAGLNVAARDGIAQTFYGSPRSGKPGISLYLLVRASPTITPTVTAVFTGYILAA
jgi:hypothetical protein